MELLEQFKRNGFFGAEIYYFLLSEKKTDWFLHMTPSIYLKEMQLNSFERISRLCSSPLDDVRMNAGPKNNAVLSFSPKLLVYQNFGSHDKIVAKFMVKNISQATTYISMVCKDNSIFAIKPQHLKTSRLAPGISVTFTVTFTPDQPKDYMHRVDFFTGDDKYTMPIIALGPRPLFDFPDEVDVPRTPMKIETSRVITIRNIGHIHSGFTLTTKSPFYVFPKSANVDPGDGVEFTISFKSMNLGEFYGTLLASFETGENLIISLKGTTYPVDVVVDNQFVRFVETYNTMSRQLTIHIKNHSPNILSYMCMRNDSVRSDFVEKMKLAHAFDSLKDSESQKCRKLVEYDILSCQDHKKVYTRIFQDELQVLVADETFLFQNKHFSITPLTGTLWPNTSTDINVVFSPKALDELEAVAYLDIDGVEGRIPVRMTGTSLAPAVRLNVETLDMDRVYVNNLYNYELVAMNKGHIDGVVAYKKVPVLFGSVIACTPAVHCLEPGESKVFVVSFINNNQGHYFEEIQFSILDTDITLKVYLKGELVFPSLSFSTTILDFGRVSVGVPTAQVFNVINESTIEVKADLKMLSDGPEVNSIPLVDFAIADFPKPTAPAWPKEFQIEPHTLAIEPESHVSVEIVLTANLVRANQTCVELELLNADSSSISLPITYNALVPEIKTQGDILLKACFLDHPYPQQIVFTSNEITGYYILESIQNDCSMRVDILQTEGYVEPNSATCIPIVIQIDELGVQSSTIRMRLFGLTEPINICNITVCGVAPIITWSPSAIQWGHVKLLNKVDRILTLINDSPIAVTFEALLQNDDGKWQVKVRKESIPAESTFELVISLYLIDADTYQNKLIMKIDNLKDILVPLSAVGIGTSIVVGELRDRVMLGRHFTKIPMECIVTMENCGTRLHTLEWSPHYKQAKNKNLPTHFFALEPYTFKMAASEKLELMVKAVSNKPLTVTETWFLIGSVEGINKKELLMECPFEAQFVDPKIEVSTDFIELQYDYSPYSEHYNLTDIFTIKNISTLPLDMEISVRQPFAFVQRKSTYKIDKDDYNLCNCICYNISDLNIDALMHKSDPFVCKEFIDYLTKKPVPPIRTDYLRFFQEINKLKLAFHLTQYVNELLEDEEAMKLQIVFDTTKHGTLKSKEFLDLIRIKFKKHKNKDHLKVVGRINFPNVTISPTRLDFQCVPCWSVNSMTITLHNPTPLILCYQFQWKNFSYTEIETPQEVTIVKVPSPVRKTTEKINEDELREILATRKSVLSLIEQTDTRAVSENHIRNSAQDLDSELPLSNDILNDEESKVLKIITPLLSIDPEEPFEWNCKLPKISKENYPIQELIEVVPNRGILKPDECQHVHVTFSPKRALKMKATLECSVLGGPSETVIVMGTSSGLQYALNTDVLNFQIRPYHEKATEDLKLLNSGPLPFDYLTYITRGHMSDKHEAKILEITPASKRLEHNEAVNIKVGVDPGIMGYFCRTFLLEIGSLQAMKIDVIGWGVIPQVYLCLLRPHIKNIPAEVGYRAIATLTSEFVEILHRIFDGNGPSHMNTPLSSQCSGSPVLDHTDEWYICNESDGYPTAMDIELALERILVMEYIDENPDALKASSYSKNGPIPGIFTSPYLVDYGVVIVGTTAVCGVQVVNYGPGPTRLYRAKCSALPPWLVVKLSGRIGPGDTSWFDVVFSPIPEQFTELEELVETTFNLEVPWGVSIPVSVRATCAVPYLVSNVNNINFGQVRCGDKVVCSIPLKNVGKSTCIWFVTLKLKNRVPNTITILNGSGKYEPGEGGLLYIAFKPTLEMTFEGVLVFNFHMNPSRMILPVAGRGALPRVRVIGANVNFPPTLPWERTSSLYFGLTNPCSFPIELIFAHSDEKWHEEEAIFDMLYKYYDKPGEMLVPLIEPGSGLPTNVTRFYKDLIEKSHSYQQDDATSHTLSARSTTTARKTPKKSMMYAKPLNQSALTIRSGAEIIADELAVLKSEGVDPLKESVKEYEDIHADSVTSDDSFGVIIFTYGSPATQVYAMELAYSIGKRLKLPVVNLDNAVVEALCTVESETRAALVGVLKEAHQACLATSSASTRQKLSSKDVVRESTEEIVQEAEGEEEDDRDFDIIYKKLFMICNSKNIGTTTSDKKSKKKPSSSTVDLGSSSMTGLPLDLLLELLKEFFSAPRFAEGFVVDSLSSWVLKQPAHALTTVLKCRPGVRTVTLLLCHSEFSKWAATYEERERANELLTVEVPDEMNETEIQHLIQEFEEMYASDYENSSPDLRSIYVNLGLEERRKTFLEKCPTARSANKSMNQNDTSFRSINGPELSATKKPKKGDTPSTTATSKKIDPKSGKPTSEYLLMNMKFNEYQKNTFDQLLSIANNWSIRDCELGSPLMSLTGQPVGVVPKKGAKKKSEIQLPGVDTNLADRGFPLILVACPCLDYKEGIVNMLAHCPLIRAARTPKQPVDVLTLPVNCMKYTVLASKVLPPIERVECLQLKYLDETAIKKCECNTPLDLQELEDSTQENVVNTLSTWHCTCGKQLTSSTTSITGTPQVSSAQPAQDNGRRETYPQALHSVRSLTSRKGRLILEQGDLLRCKYSFNPQMEGQYSVKRFVEVSGWPESRMVITATGICDLPKLDRRPKKVFSNFVRRTMEDVVYKSVFLDDRKVFDFGPIFIGAERVYEEFAIFSMRNSSLLNCDVTFSFLEQMEVFKLDESLIHLEPGCRAGLKVKAAPSALGNFTNSVLCSIKYNPEIVKIQIACSGVVPHVEILPTSKIIDYGKLLLYRREEDRFIVKNDSILPILWKIRNTDDFLESFILTHTSGVVESNSNQIIVVTYIACQVGIITNKELIIDIYEASGRGAPMLSDTLAVSAECYDVQVDCAFESATDSGLCYGDVKVNSSVSKDMYFLNRGKYDIFYKIKKVKNFPEPSFLKTMEISQDCGIVPPTMRMVDVQFSCTPTTRMDLHNVPAFMCSFIDGTNNQIVVSKYPIRLSIASFYNTFTLFPLGELNFHVIPVGVISSRDIIINNTSRCPITYEIEVPIIYQGLPASNIRQTTKDAKQKEPKKPLIPSIKCGNFTIMNDDSILAPGASRKIEVQFFSTKAIRFEEVLNFIVNDTCPSEAVGVPLTLVGTGAVPSLDIWNIDTTFREHMILKNLKDYQVQETAPHCVFVEDSVTLHFFCVTVNGSYTANIDLYNNGLVAAALSMTLQYQENSDKSIFYLDKYSTHIEPLVHRNLAIIFAPKALQNYRAVLEIRLKLLQDREDIYKICLIGEGVIPRIKMLEPPFKDMKTSSIVFPATLVNSLSSLAIRMTNISSVKSTVVVDVVQKSFIGQPTFWLTVFDEPTEQMLKMWDSVMGFSSEQFNTGLKLELLPRAVATIHACYTPSEKGKNQCDVKIVIINNPYEYFTIVCKGEAFIEDVTLLGIDMLPMDYEVEIMRFSDLESVTGKESSATNDGKKKVKTPEPKKDKKKKEPKKPLSDLGVSSQTDLEENAVLKYVLNLGGCELDILHKRSAVLVNHSLKVYKFSWHVIANVVVKPATGYISPGEEKDVEINFLSDEVIVIDKMNLYCNLVALGPDSVEINGPLWESRQIITVFNKSREADIYKRHESILEDPQLLITESFGPTIDMVIVFSAVVDYAKYTCSINEDLVMKDTFMYQTRSSDLEIENTGVVPMKISWSFQIDEEYPTRIDELDSNQELIEDYSQGDYRRSSDQTHPTSETITESEELDVGTLYSDSETRGSADTWFEICMPFSIEPVKECISAGKKKMFKLTFTPKEPFNYKVKLNSYIEKLHPDYSSVSLRVTGTSLVPYCHLEFEESDYVSSGRRKANFPVLSAHTRVMEFQVLGAGCYKKKVSVVNPTSESYRFFLEAAPIEGKEVVPVHCDTPEAYLHSGHSAEICFTFAPSAPGTYESIWKFMIPQHSFEVDLLVVGIVREPDVVFVPTILILDKTVVGGSTTSLVRLKNRESEGLHFKFTGNSLCNESGKQPVIVDPEMGTVTASSEACINVTYKPIVSGNLSFKIFCEISSLVKPLVLCVNAMSHLLKPKVTYFLLHYEHELQSDAITNIHIEKVASHYERIIRFVIKNEGSIAFQYQWQYVNSPVKKYMDIEFSPKEGCIEPGDEVESVMAFTIRDVPVVGYPVTLSIEGGPEYNVYLHAEINKPVYQFSFTSYDFGKCIINAPDTTYLKNIVFANNDSAVVTLDLDFANSPEIYVDFNSKLSLVQPKDKLKIPVYFRPKQAKCYTFVFPFRVNSLVANDITMSGEGVPLMFDLHEGCQKSVHLGAVRLGSKVTAEVEVMNHSKVSVDARFTFADASAEAEGDDGDSQATSECLSPSSGKMGAAQKEAMSRVKMLKLDKDARIKEKQSKDMQNSLKALKVIPTHAVIKPHQKIAVKIQFKPTGLIKTLNMQLCMSVFTVTKPLVQLTGCATGMSLRFSQSSLQFGAVRRHGCKTLKVMLLNQGDVGARFFWQPIRGDVFTISPFEGTIAPQTTVTFSISFKPTYNNPFVKTWVICNIENYHPLELALYGSCLDLDNYETKTLNFECAARDYETVHVNISNKSDDVWQVVPSVTGTAFDTLKKFTLEPNSSIDVPITFNPKTMGEHEGQVLFSPLGENALYFLLSGLADAPQPNGICELDVVCKETFTEDLFVYNLTEFPETYLTQTEVMRVSPDGFTGYYEIKCPKVVKVWGEASATCRWTIVIYEECTMHLKVSFINQETREYQYYFVVVRVKPSAVVGTIELCARARESVQTKITVTNPLSEDVPFIVHCSNEYITCDEQVAVTRKSEAQFNVTYSPLVTGETEDYVEAGHPLVGVYVYRLRLSCLPAKEKSLQVAVPLGKSAPMRLRVQNRTDKMAQFACTTTSSSFMVDKEYPLGPNGKGKFLIWFEPIDLGIQNAVITFSSPIAGDFVFNIEGKAAAPKPQGPIEIKSGSSNTITFKNVFEDMRTFKINVDREEFSVKSMFEVAKPKKEIKVQVFMRKLSSEVNICPTGCLTIECHEPAEPRVTWTYFLQGIL